MGPKNGIDILEMERVSFPYLHKMSGLPARKVVAILNILIRMQNIN